jgi:hypothetical protein
VRRVPPPGDDTLTTVSGVSLFDGRGFVHVTWGDRRGQLAPDAARRLGLHIIETADAADHDAALMAVLTDTGLEPEQAGQMLLHVRERRAREDDGD